MPDESEEASPSQAIDLMPLTTTGSELVPDESEEASPSQAIDLMPSPPRVARARARRGVEENEEASTSNNGLMPLTSKNIDE